MERKGVKRSALVVLLGVVTIMLTVMLGVLVQSMGGALPERARRFRRPRWQLLERRA